MRNKEETKRKLIAAVGSLLARKGFAKLGVNAVANEAKVDKVLIYRYFGDFESLCKSYAESTDFWPTVDEVIGDRHTFKALSLRQRLSKTAISYAKSLRSRPITLELMAWELIERNAFTEELETIRENFGIELTAVLVGDSKDPSSKDWTAITTIISAAMQYLALRARKISVYNTIDISSDEGWQRIETTIVDLINLLTEEAYE